MPQSDRMIPRLCILDALNELLQGDYLITCDNNSDELRAVKFNCFALRLLFAKETSDNFIVFVEPPVPTDPDTSPAQRQKMSWEILLQVCMTYTEQNARDWRMPYRMEYLIRQKLMSFRRQYLTQTSISGRLGGLSGGGADVANLDKLSLGVRYMKDLVVNAGVVRADEKSTDKVFCWIPVEIQYVEG